MTTKPTGMWRAMIRLINAIAALIEEKALNESVGWVEGKR